MPMSRRRSDAIALSARPQTARSAAAWSLRPRCFAQLPQSGRIRGRGRKVERITNGGSRPFPAPRYRTAPPTGIPAVDRATPALLNAKPASVAARPFLRVLPILAVAIAFRKCWPQVDRSSAVRGDQVLPWRRSLAGASRNAALSTAVRFDGVRRVDTAVGRHLRQATGGQHRIDQCDRGTQIITQ